MSICSLSSLPRLVFRWLVTPSAENASALAHQASILEQCADWIDEGKLRIHLSQTFPLTEAVTAHKTLESGSMMGKIALLID